MPELAEVETVVRELRPHVVGKTIADVQSSKHALRRPWLRKQSRKVCGRTISGINRRGKWIIVNLTGDSHILLHLGMTGQLRVLPANMAIADHTHLIFHLAPGTRQLRFRDVRRFGCGMVFESSEQVQRYFEEAKLGPEPFEVSTEYLRSIIGKSARSLKAILLDQRVIAGVGNIYADESLFCARLHPAQLGRDTTAQQFHRLHRAINEVLTRAVECRGSSIRDYIGGSGRKGAFQDEFKVYGRRGKPCPRCGTAVQCIRLGGRSTHFCPRCQKL